VEAKVFVFDEVVDVENPAGNQPDGGLALGQEQRQPSACGID
jgi:hypothetical protein